MTMMTIEQWTYVLPILKGIAYPLFKVSLIAMSEKLFQGALSELSFESTSTNDDANQEDEEEVSSIVLLQAVQDQIFEPIKDSRVTSFYLMDTLSFLQTFLVSVILVLIIAIVYPLTRAISEEYLCRMEIKRLQRLCYKKFILESNSFNVADASDLVHAKLGIIEKYWIQTKYSQVGDVTTIAFGLMLFFALSWDLGLITLSLAFIIFVISSFVYSKLSTPYADSIAMKTKRTSSRLLDLVQCKEVVVAHAREEEEQVDLQASIDSDKHEIYKMVWAVFLSNFIETATFTMIMPTLCVFVYYVDLTTERVFQLLLVVVVLDELLRSYLAYTSHTAIKNDFHRVQNEICVVLGMDKDDLFPPVFTIPRFSRKKKNVHRTTKGCKEEKKEKDEDVDDDDDRDNTSVLTEFAVPMGTDDDETQDGKRTTRVVPSSISSKAITAHIKDPTSSKKKKNVLNFQGVVLGYKALDGSEFRVVNDLNLQLKIGKHYAILGETGAGKSTIYKVLAGLIRPLDGQIELDGKLIDTSCRTWREQIGVVSQTSILLNRTLRENLTYGQKETNMSTDDEIMDALDRVNMKDRVWALPDELDTLIQESGNEFSGGQRQRFQIARLLLRDSPIILLDECTSALDSDTTEDILKVLKPFLAGKTLIMITHDLETLVLAETILKMNVGGHIEKIKSKKKTKSPTDKKNSTTKKKSKSDD